MTNLHLVIQYFTLWTSAPLTKSFFSSFNPIFIILVLPYFNYFFTLCALFLTKN